MIGIFKKMAKTGIGRVTDLLCRLEFAPPSFTRFNERPVELSFLFKNLSVFYPKKILDIGSGTSSLPHLIRMCGMEVKATDYKSSYWSNSLINRHYIVQKDDITNTDIKGSFDFIVCISALEHIPNHNDAVKNMFGLLSGQGHILLTFPYTEKSYKHNVYELPGSTYGQKSPYITQSFSRAEINGWLKANNGRIVSQEYWQFWDGDYWTVGNQVIPPRLVGSEEKHQITCILLAKSMEGITADK